ncbi:MAG: hypothetical protein COY38_03695 [Candidatus Aenigmarchaeota archaeon CG_4_10_14_0_8_um_filter_37_24]|nr:hypothetical protein [Candidatus Aenigmarchaeota archaeon]OIN88209.1 MAG: hypothetical protein AUJ50_01425 [Candidatus Aenigmarchaeota archaeon CG1_02_38_14]PIV68684.1 MAG: hypothetical protein COS07_03340 [Candidatus Aenigmarchaeota archaeon CG01_land_8_20_14_3_00_37_9]PIW41164.1 MAG: hypothetical protein COW21_03230 [Candidatus Aenigmarchaeota archaeon CG15_BIG_FIL_POST_REV_8_21_14_020_37_27]PIX50794.1 MAG: hypothetical protein COZ52_02155 [Candidatus Aenigmarchaeota archaeon CG_4_8_14_3_u
MGAMIKLLIGVVLLVVPLGMYAYEIMNGVGNGINIPVIGTVKLWQSLVTLLVGSIPPLVMLIGLFVVWLELDEWRIEKELKKEEPKEEEKEESKPEVKKTTRKRATRKKK